MICASASLNMSVRWVVFTLVFFRYSFSVIHCVEHEQHLPTATSPDKMSQQSSENATEENDISKCERSFCLRKCCPPGEGYLNLTNWTSCIPVQHEHFVKNAKKIELHNDSQSISTLLDTVNSSYDKLHLVHGKPCKQFFRLEPNNDTFHLSTNGSRLFVELSEWNEFRVSEYCLELFADVDQILPTICLSAVKIGESSTVVHTVYPIAMAISISLLFVTFLTYASLKELRNLHGKKLMSHVAILLIGYSFLILIQVYQFYDTWPEFCVFSAVVVQFSFLASFFWLNVMCFDLWWTFSYSTYRSFPGSPNETDRKKFIVYSVYAWGCPTIVTSITLLAEFWPDMPDIFVRPEFATQSCWFNGNRAILYYFYGPISLLLILNLMMFLSTTFNIIRRKKDCKVLKRTGSKRHSSETEQQRFFVYLKLFIVMGVNWSTEIISWLAGGPDYLWYFTDIGNALQGVLIFVIFICNRRVLRILKQKFCPNTPFFNRAIRSPSSRSTSVTSVGSTKPDFRNSTRLPMSNVTS